MRFSAQNLTCVRNYKTLFEDLSFDLEGGQLLLIEGHNGAGKTTLLKLLTGLKRADAGQVLWNNHDINSEINDFRSNLSWLGHQNPIKHQQTGRENLEMLAQLHPRSQLSVADALRQVGLANAKNKLVKTYSAGMKRRLSLASLLVAQTKLWILDEPQASLDKAGIQLFEEMAQTHLDNNGMIIMTSHHDVNLANHTPTRLTIGRKPKDERV